LLAEKVAHTVYAMMTPVVRKERRDLRMTTTIQTNFSAVRQVLGNVHLKAQYIYTVNLPGPIMPSRGHDGGEPSPVWSTGQMICLQWAVSRSSGGGVGYSC